MSALSPVLKQATPVLAERGEGVHLYDTSGRRHLDFTAGIGVTSTGHCHPKVTAAAQEQVGKLVHGQYTTVLHQPLLTLTERLGEVLPEGLDSLFFANSGSEGVEAAMRLAKQATGRPNIVVFQGSFHGRTLGAASLTTSAAKVRSGFGPLMPGVAVAPFPNAYYYGWDEETATKFALRELDQILATISAPADTAAFIIEPVLGDGGFVPANAAFLQGLRERADRHGIHLILDEVQAGFGRTGKFWGHDHFGVRPDILVTAKGLASGFPLSAIAASEALMAKAWPGSQGGTYGGNAVSCAAAIATLEVIKEEKLVENAAERGDQLIAGLREVAAAHPASEGVGGIGDVRGLGLMLASEIVDSEGDPDGATAGKLLAAAAERGLLLLPCGAHGNVVRMLPPLVVNENQIDDALRLWGETVTAVLG
ncbi:aspartate aminotransferase family protein [Streptomyces sp. NBC_01361]|uniref:aspartate aminotransferase family protein n=1 Tax=Streptomyces sp. NBC_01361 TaxID=2903838 RepID=UPI002E2FF9B9|nr:aminotransferase class III-fold pyridoxal phosphate-dependent enzyme [Streptomyces sp. NBC_01361]